MIAIPTKQSKRQVWTVVDQFNPSKIWKVYHSPCRHYYMEQWIKGRKVGNKIRTTLAHLKDIGVM